MRSKGGIFQWVNACDVLILQRLSLYRWTLVKDHLDIHSSPKNRRNATVISGFFMVTLDLGNLPRVMSTMVNAPVLYNSINVIPGRILCPPPPPQPKGGLYIKVRMYYNTCQPRPMKLPGILEQFKLEIQILHSKTLKVSQSISRRRR